jgi:serine/threonine-protein kinase RsbT
MDQEHETITLLDNFDVVMARQRARELSRELGFGLTDQTRIATAVSEVARRAVQNQGAIAFAVIMDGHRRGIECTCHGCEVPDTPPSGPTGEVLGGIYGVERLMDEFTLEHAGGRTVILMRKWLPE